MSVFTPSEKRLSVLSIGSFGTAVASHLVRRGYKVTQLSCDQQGIPLADPGTPPDAYILASSSPIRTVARELEKIGRRQDRPFFPVTIDSSALFVGPLVVPGLGACFTCWERRSLQHTVSRKERKTLLEFYDSSRHTGPAGFLHAFALIGAASLAGVLEDAEELTRRAGQVWVVDLFTRAVSSGKVVGIDGCAHCGLARDLQNRSFAQMKSELADLWMDSELPIMGRGVGTGVA
jgi:bacteriocin biosynthesis cyclodehydratase domain-containing protein